MNCIFIRYINSKILEREKGSDREKGMKEGKVGVGRERERRNVLRPFMTRITA